MTEQLYIKPLDLISNLPTYQKSIYDYILDLIDYTDLHFTIQEKNYYKELGLPWLNNDNIDVKENEIKFNIQCKRIVYTEKDFKKLNGYCDAIKKYISYKQKYKALPPSISRTILENHVYYYSMFVTFVRDLIIQHIKPNTRFKTNFYTYVTSLLYFEQPPTAVPKKFSDSGFWNMFTGFCNKFHTEIVPSIDFNESSSQGSQTRQGGGKRLVVYNTSRLRRTTSKRKSATKRPHRSHRPHHRRHRRRTSRK